MPRKAAKVTKSTKRTPKDVVPDPTNKTHELIFWCKKEETMMHELVNKESNTVECPMCWKKLQVNYSTCEFVKDKDHVMKVVSELGIEV